MRKKQNLRLLKCDENIVNSVSDAKSACFDKSKEHVDSEVDFGGQLVTKTDFRDGFSKSEF